MFHNRVLRSTESKLRISGNVLEFSREMGPIGHKYEYMCVYNNKCIYLYTNTFITGN